MFAISDCKEHMQWMLKCIMYVDIYVFKKKVPTSTVCRICYKIADMDFL